MSHPKPFAGRRHEVSRLEGFSDAVFAFALTLLVVSLEVPRTFDELWNAMRGFLAFAVCFALLFQVWSRHHTYFRRYGLDDTFTHAMTAVMLFVVLFYVYPLKFLWTLVITTRLGSGQVLMATGRMEPMIRNEQVHVLFEIYGLGAAAVFATFVALYWHAYKKRDALRLTPDEILSTRLSIMSSVGMASIGLASVALAWVGNRIGSAAVIEAAGYIYTFIGLNEWVIGSYGRRQRDRLLSGA
jgi:transmembrane protein TMEM174 (potassium channel)